MAMLVLLGADSLLFARPETGLYQGDYPLVTNLSQLRRVTLGKPGLMLAFDLTGTVLGENRQQGIFVLQDSSGTELLETTLRNQPARIGQKIRLQGTNYVISTAIGVSLGKVPLIDNNGRHPVTEVSSSVYLKQGYYPIKVFWFNYTSLWFLGLDYSGPDFGRKPVPASVLLRPVATASDGTKRIERKLTYRCYEGQWRTLPDFSNLVPIKSGVCTNFDLGVKAREDHVALTFGGYLKIATNGVYTFYLASDDGSQLYINQLPTWLTVVGKGMVEPPKLLDPVRQARGVKGPFWAEAEGTIVFLGAVSGGFEMDLATSQSRLRVFVRDVSSLIPSHLLGSRVLVQGICLDTRDLQMYRVINTVVAPSFSNVQVESLSSEAWSMSTAHVTIKECKSASTEYVNKQVILQGRIHPSSLGHDVVLQDETGRVPVDLINQTLPKPDEEVECLGDWVNDGTNEILRWAFWRSLSHHNPQGDQDVAGLLTTASQVQQLTRAEARQPYWVKIRGVVTWVSSQNNAMVIEDASAGGYAGRGVSVNLRSPWNQHPPVVGEILEVEGTNGRGDFSPIIDLTNVTRLGMGVLPAPKHPTFDELLSGSMDSQYVEIRGYVTSAWSHHVTLLMQGGKIDVEFEPDPPDDLNSLVHSVVRIRGVMFAKWNPSTLLVTPEHPLWFGNATICVVTPPLANPFDEHKLRVRELMQFDAQANIFKPVRVSGQILSVYQKTFYCTDNGFGFRCIPTQVVELIPGDEIDISGLVEISRSSPIIREAVVQKTGHGPLPTPVPLAFGGTNSVRDSTRVFVEGRLLDLKNSGDSLLLQIQQGTQTFPALVLNCGKAKLGWKLGSILKLTGTYSDTQREAYGMATNSVALFINNPKDVVVLAQPPWWTLDRLLGVAGILTAGLALTLVWISLLRRQVMRRTAELKHEISARQRVEQARAIEQERARIAEDLHDDLGSRVTAISMLAMSGTGNEFGQNAGRETFEKIVERSHSLVSALDELVWAANPKYDTIAALAEYLAGITEELLTETGIARHIEMPVHLPHQRIAAEKRHNVLLSVKEALNNAIRHGKPSEVLLQLTVNEGEIEIAIRDNGCGFDPSAPRSGDGLANLQKRMSNIGGCCSFQSVPYHGTTVKLFLPV